MYATVQNPTELQYDWELDKLLLRGYDRDRDIAALAAFIGVRPIET